MGDFYVGTANAKHHIPSHRAQLVHDGLLGHTTKWRLSGDGFKLNAASHLRYERITLKYKVFE